jgi:multidrug efflux pump subunit AcrA (membrane-fusion protein)
MKKSDLGTRVIIAIIFVAILSYFGFSIAQSLMNPFKSTLAVNMTVQEGIRAAGIVVRNETVIGSGGYAAVDVAVSEGEKVSAGGLIAGVYASESVLVKVREAEALEVKIQNLESVINAGADTANMKALDENIKDSIFKLVKSVHSRSLSGIAGVSTKLQANILVKNSGGSNLQAQLLSLRQQRLALGTALSSNRITAPVSGLFSASLDGFESVKTEGLTSLNVQSLKALMAEKRSPEPNALGKLVSGARWYYAAILSTDDARKLIIGDTASMIFGRYLGAVIEMGVESIGAPQDGQCVVLFSSNRNLGAMLSIRMQTVQIILKEYSGIRVPKIAICLTSEGKSCVYTLSGVYSEQKLVKILYEAEDYYIVESSGSSGVLRAGDQVITSTKDLYNGKLVK